MNSNYLTRGSEWRKWDLHVHTPESIYHKYGADEDVWEKYISDLEQLPTEYAVLGINDYIFIDGYARLLHEKNVNGRLKNIDLLLPVVEFRIEKFAGVNFKQLKRINLHVIFSNDVTVETIQSQFLNALQQHYQITDDGAWSRIPTRESLMELGSKLKAAAPEGKKLIGSDLIVGFNNLNISDDKIYEALRKDCFDNKFLIAIGKTEWDELNWTESSMASKRSIINRADIIFTASDSVEAFLKAKKKLAENNVKDLLLDCSDAHYFSNSSDKDRIGNCFSWIKADPTFEGLKQILYEPEDRICIQEGLPEEKNDYQVIESVQFIDDEFLPEIIPINQNLTTIVGGKSTGKSLLLRNIAKTIDPIEVKNRLDEVALLDYSEPVSGFTVKWRDRQEQKLGSSVNPTKKIIYIPQSYLNRLVDIKEENSSIDVIIKNVLLQTPEVKQAYAQLESDSRNIHQNITKEIDNLFFYLEDWQTKVEEVKQVGDKKGVEEELKKLNAEIQELKVRSGMTEQEIENYNLIRNSINDGKERFDKLSEDIATLERAREFEVSAFPLLSLNLSSVQSIIDLNIEQLKLENSKKWNKLITEQIAIIKQSQTEINVEVIKKSKEIEPAIEKLKEASLLNDKMKRFDLESEKLKKIQTEEAIISKIGEKYLETFAHILSLHTQYHQIMFDAKSKILDQRIIDGELDFDLKIAFRTSNFQSAFINQMFDMRKLSNFSEIDLSKFEFSTQQNFEKDTEKIMRAIIGSVLSLKSGYSKKDAIRKLLENWYIFDYIITHNGDSLSRMSPGKKSFVLLKLLIELDNSKCPILLDQPEDDLDNRSIYFDLVSFVKSKKKERQIILVTHNPNLVVGADAEEVIVANRKGEQSPNNHYEFEYISGALEDTRENDVAVISTLGKQGIQEHVCDILEGGKSAFEKRSQKYNIH